MNQPTPNARGLKITEGKLDWTLLPIQEIEEVVKVLQYGSNKYSRDNWKNQSQADYTAAIYRHLAEHRKGRIKDKETGLPHMAHIICSALFLMWIDHNKK